MSGARWLRAEWTKLRTSPGTAWLLLAVVAVTVAVSAAAAASARCPAVGCGQDPGKISLTGVDLGQAVVAIVAVLAVGGEYSTGMIRTTLAAMPGRVSRAGRQGGRGHRAHPGRRGARRCSAACSPGGSSCPGTASPGRTGSRR